MTITFTLAGVLLTLLLIAVVVALISLYGQGAALKDLERRMEYRKESDERTYDRINRVRDDLRNVERIVAKMDASFGSVVAAWLASQTDKKEN